MSDNNKRQGDLDGDRSAAKKPKLDTLDQIQQARNEIQAKLAAIKKMAGQGAAQPGSEAPSAPLLGQTGSAAAALPTPLSASAPLSTPSTSTSTSSLPGGMTDVARKIEEAKARLKATIAASSQASILSPAPPADKSKSGLNFQLPDFNDPSAMPKPIFATTKANMRMMEKKAEKAAAVAAEKKEIKLLPPPSKEEVFDVSYFDEKLAVASSLAPRPRPSRSLRFAQKGKFIEQANQMRAQAQLEQLKKQIAETVKKTGMDENLDLVSDAAIRKEPPPEVEWWDVQLVPNVSYDEFDPSTDFNDEEDPPITELVQHPIPIPPPAEPDAPAPRPMMLTAKERKKLRRQRRLEAQREKRDKIRLGLLPPDQPKVKISNLMRVLGTEAVQDPTKVEAYVRKQVADRQLAHKQHNEATKLSEEARRDKKEKKMAEDTSKFVHVAVFKVVDLGCKLHITKIDKNAEQNKLTGVCIIHQGLNLVIVEGGPKGIKRYKKLMLRRMDWSETSQDREREDDDDAGSDAEGDDKQNGCQLVWEGQVKDRVFKGFRIRPFPTDFMVREFLERFGVVHYWETAKNLVEVGA
ncbi:pre-mRNA processing factor 3-domain-containing protein [Polychytrium aggregatum]|uniref:pre-mRNA processing factor 3-domain-containing protein n=1 Tax=Polychytrium aggregatum TaxID=110093 RepID=UPI0022FF1804|nr:pre-mRNA processing factor 3-domain-containing protein [Polychytrium aggregatum]KAI9207925.1 pre-mRNA processing factor 3-domain-containing protein [Polychytrium aggregatum]